MNRLAAAAACVAIAWLASGIRLHAHEIGTTRVVAHLQDGRRYEIQIVTDATALAEKLDVLARAQGLSWDDTFRQRVAVAFDGVAVRPAIQYVVSPAQDATSPPLATIRLSGDIPPGAQSFTWMYSWTFATYALSVSAGEAVAPMTEWLEARQISTPVSLSAPPPVVGRAETAWRYLTLGFTHIVPHGLDHMLFVIGIFLLSRRLRSVLAQVTAFTVAHSVTLGLSIYGVIAVPAAVVEPLIAVSIAFIAVENLLETELKSRRIALVFACGLLHGMGFAGALQELGLPRTEFVTALVTFNVGVEMGQLAVIAAAFALVGWQWSNRAWYRHRVVVPVSVLIACTAVYWTVERMVL